MSTNGKGAKAGPWAIEERMIIDNDGVTPAWWISDGEKELLTATDPTELLIAIAKLFGIEKFETVPDEETA